MDEEIRLSGPPQHSSYLCKVEALLSGEGGKKGGFTEEHGYSFALVSLFVKPLLTFPTPITFKDLPSLRLWVLFWSFTNSKNDVVDAITT